MYAYFCQRIINIYTVNCALFFRLWHQSIERLIIFYWLIKCQIKWSLSCHTWLYSHTYCNTYLHIHYSRLLINWIFKFAHFTPVHSIITSCSTPSTCTVLIHWCAICAHMCKVSSHISTRLSVVGLHCDSVITVGFIYWQFITVRHAPGGTSARLAPNTSGMDGYCCGCCWYAGHAAGAVDMQGMLQVLLICRACCRCCGLKNACCGCCWCAGLAAGAVV